MIFKKIDEYRDYPIVIYGLGEKTKNLLCELKDYNIIGLLDGFKNNGSLYGKPIIDLSKASSKKVKLIIVAARPASCKTIAKKIHEFCIQNNISLLDVEGNDLLKQNDRFYFFENNGLRKSEFIEKCSKYDSIIINVFDTLIMRKVLDEYDKFMLIDYKLQSKGIIIKNFAQKRKSCQEELSNEKFPSLTSIYNYMINKYISDKNSISINELVNIEFDLECQLVIPRKEVVDCLLQLHNCGKTIYIISNDYYTRDHIKKLLELCDIRKYTDVYSLCDYGLHKKGQLMDSLKSFNQNNNSIYIYGNKNDTIKNILKNKSTAIHLLSAAELLSIIRITEFNGNYNNLSSRLKIALFISKIFNSPFQFENEKNYITVKNGYDIGYLFFAPIITDFTIWFHDQIKKYNIENIWFGARDGYLIKKLYDILEPINESIYFLTSRTVAVKSGVKTIHDIEYVDDMKFSGSIQDNIEKRFGLKIENKENNNSLMMYSEQILQAAKDNRKHYLKYIDKLNVKNGNIAFMDFVAKGTTQLYLEKIINKKIIGMYFLQLEKSYMENKHIEIHEFCDNCKEIYNNYYFMETILTSPFPSIDEFDTDGNAIYTKETRKKEEIEYIKLVQKGVIDYFSEYIYKGYDLIDKNIDLNILKLIHNIKIEDFDFLNLKIEDPFFNRTTNVSDLL